MDLTSSQPKRWQKFRGSTLYCYNIAVDVSMGCQPCGPFPNQMCEGGNSDMELFNYLPEISWIEISDSTLIKVNCLVTTPTANLFVSNLSSSCSISNSLSTSRTRSFVSTVASSRSISSCSRPLARTPSAKVIKQKVYQEDNVERSKQEMQKD